MIQSNIHPGINRNCPALLHPASQPAKQTDNASASNPPKDAARTAFDGQLRQILLELARRAVIPR